MSDEPEEGPPPVAELRTINLFSGKTVLEEAEQIAHEEEAMESRPEGPRDLVTEAEDGAIRWLGMDAFNEGDDVKVAVHKGGHAVVVLVSATASGPYGTSTFKLSRKQWTKLRALVKEG